MKMAQINGVRLHYSDEGPADSTALVFANSLGTDFRLWDRLLPYLPENTRRVRMDKRGHGLSECPAAPYRMEDLVADAAALLDQLEVRNAVFIGLSIGGMIAQGLAASRPDLVRMMVLCDTAARIGSAEMWDQRIDAIERGGIAALEQPILERWFTKAFRENCGDELAGWRHMLCRTPEDGYVGCAYALRNADLVAETSTLTIPCLAVAGDEDGSTPPELVENTAKLIAGSRFEVIAGSGHLPCVEQPEVLGGLITEFLRDHGLA